MTLEEFVEETIEEIIRGVAANGQVWSPVMFKIYIAGQDEDVYPCSKEVARAEIQFSVNVGDKK